MHRKYNQFVMTVFSLTIAIAMIPSCNPYKDEIETAKRAKEEAERKLKEEKTAIDTIYKK